MREKAIELVKQSLMSRKDDVSVRCKLGRVVRVTQLPAANALGEFARFVDIIPTCC
jgi:hypothetical protein